tara:strand:+ start:561 stop:878 length:318 start_codon:yes stop_codon:yes gene_type:complete
MEITKTYQAIRAKRFRTPWGYDKDKEDKSILHPDQKALEVLELVIEFLAVKAMSTTKAAEYLLYETNRPLTKEGLRLIARNKRHPVFTEYKLSSEPYQERPKETS